MSTSFGDVRLGSMDAEPLTGTWSEGDTVFTVPYSGLEYGTSYGVYVVGFITAVYGDGSNHITPWGTFTTVTAGTVTISEIPGIRVAAGETAALTVDTAQYSGIISWSPALDDGRFGHNTAYTATITLTAKPGFIFDGVGEDFFTMTGALSAANDAGGNVVIVYFPATDTGGGNNTVIIIAAAAIAVAAIGAIAYFFLRRP
jgi:hypothetical protein